MVIEELVSASRYDLNKVDTFLTRFYHTPMLKKCYSNQKKKYILRS